MKDAASIVGSFSIIVMMSIILLIVVVIAGTCLFLGIGFYELTELMQTPPPY